MLWDPIYISSKTGKPVAAVGDQDSSSPLYVLSEQSLQEVNTKGFCPLHSDSQMLVMTLNIYNRDTFTSQVCTPYLNVSVIITIAVQPQEAESEGLVGKWPWPHSQEEEEGLDVPDLKAILLDSLMEAQRESQHLLQRRELWNPVAIGLISLSAGPQNGGGLPLPRRL